jgi:hypothetical protein
VNLLQKNPRLNHSEPASYPVRRMNDVNREPEIIRGHVSLQWIGLDDLAYLVFDEDAEIELEDAKEIIRNIATRHPDGKYPSFIDVRSIRSISAEARDYFVSAAAQKFRIAEALVVETTASWLFAGFYIRFHKPDSPAKLFTSKEEAIAWLKTFLS